MRRLDTAESRFYVHVNSLTADDVNDEMHERLEGLEHVTWLPRVPCRWGGFSLLRATLVGIDAVVRSEPLPDYVLLLSGQDYPLRPAAEIESFFAEHEGTSFLDHFTLPDERWAYEKGGMNRVRYYHFERFKLRTHLLRAPFPRRRFPKGFDPYGGSAFWNLTGEAASYVSRFIAENPAFVRFFHHVKFPDELFFQTILMNSPLRATIVNDDLRYQDWSRNAANPGTLRTNDLPQLLASNKLVARKFDLDLDPRILDALDREALRVA